MERPHLAIKDSHLAPRASKKKKGTLRQQKVIGAGAEDFIMWVPPISRRSPDWEEEEEEDKMSGLIHNFATRKRKQDASLEQTVDVVPEVVEDRANLVRMGIWTCRPLSSRVHLRGFKRPANWKCYLGGVHRGFLGSCRHPGGSSSRVGRWPVR